MSRMSSLELLGDGVAAQGAVLEVDGVAGKDSGPSRGLRASNTFCASCSVAGTRLGDICLPLESYQTCAAASRLALSIPESERPSAGRPRSNSAPSSMLVPNSSTAALPRSAGLRAPE